MAIDAQKLALPRAASVPLDQDGKLRSFISPFASFSFLEDSSARSVASESASSIRSKSLSRPRKSYGSLYRAQRSTSGDLWNNSAVSESICDRHDIQALRDLCGSDNAIFIDCEELKHIKILGEGEFAEVSIAEYQGQDCTLPPDLVAVKRLKLHVMKSERDVLDFIEEVRVLHKLDHPNIVQFIGFGCMDSSSREAEWRTIFLVQEYMKGGTLKSKILEQMINRSKVVYTYTQGLRWCIGAAEALAAMHGSEPMVIHRDLKADNILLTGTGSDSVAKVADFGLHALVERRRKAGKDDDKLDSDGPDSPPLRQTKNYEVVEARKAKSAINALSNGQAAVAIEGAPMFWKMTGKTGSWVYMSPECSQGKPYNEKTDVFSFGIILLEIFSKRLLGTDYLNTTQWDESEVHAQRVANGWRPPFPAHMPESIRKLVDKCWSGVPALRPTMREVVQALVEIDLSGVTEEMDTNEIQSKGCACSIM